MNGIDIIDTYRNQMKILHDSLREAAKNGGDWQTIVDDIHALNAQLEIDLQTATW